MIDITEFNVIVMEPEQLQSCCLNDQIDYLHNDETLKILLTKLFPDKIFTYGHFTGEFYIGLYKKNIFDYSDIITKKLIEMENTRFNHIIKEYMIQNNLINNIFILDQEYNTGNFVLSNDNINYNINNNNYNINNNNYNDTNYYENDNCLIISDNSDISMICICDDKYHSIIDEYELIEDIDNITIKN
jgi:hypothetical protein